MHQLERADLLKKVFAVDLLSCPSCGGRLQLIAFNAEAGRRHNPQPGSDGLPRAS